jgi:hypothetical protein
VIVGVVFERMTGEDAVALIRKSMVVPVSEASNATSPTSPVLMSSIAASLVLPVFSVTPSCLQVIVWPVGIGPESDFASSSVLWEGVPVGKTK